MITWLRHLKDRLTEGRRLTYGETEWIVLLKDANRELSE